MQEVPNIYPLPVSKPFYTLLAKPATMKYIFIIAMMLPLFANAQSDADRYYAEQAEKRLDEAKKEKQYYEPPPIETYSLYGGYIDSTTKQLTFSNVVTVDSMSAKNLYTKAKIFIANYFKDAKSVIEVTDETNNMIVAKGSHATVVTLFSGYETPGSRCTGFVTFTLTIQCKENRFKYLLTNIAYDDICAGSSFACPIEQNFKIDKEKRLTRIDKIQFKNWSTIRIDAIENCTMLIMALKKEMAEKKSDNW